MVYHPFLVPTCGVPQGGVESPLIWIFCYDICLTRLKYEKKCFSSTVYPMLESPSFDEMLSAALPIMIQLTSFMDDLARFYNSREDMIYGTNLITAFNKIVGIRADPNKSAYVAINCTRNEQIEVEGVQSATLNQNPNIDY
jgi:Reverse transcriptase (RNA-dependent DNA polymerase)